MKSIAPITFEKVLIDSFADEQSPPYGTVATTDADGNPHVRTVHWRYLGQEAAVGFGTPIDSPKWRHLITRPTLGGCHFDMKRGIQFRWEGSAELIGSENAHRELLDTLWLQLRPTVREMYWLTAKQNESVEKRCPLFGAVLCRPTTWDLYELIGEEYRNHRRSLHVWKNGSWVSENVSLLYGTPA